MKRSRLIALIVLIASSTVAMAQIGLYAEFSAAQLNGVDTGWFYGPTFGGYFDKGHLFFLSTGLDFRGAILGTGGSTTFDSGLAGPRLVFRPHVVPIDPYVEVLGGVGHAEYNQGGAKTTETQFEYQFLGGIDVTILPRIDWRVAEFSYGALSGLSNSFNPETISTGIVLRLP